MEGFNPDPELFKGKALKELDCVRSFYRVFLATMLDAPELAVGEKMPAPSSGYDAACNAGSSRMTGLLDLTVRPPIWVGPDSGVYHDAPELAVGDAPELAASGYAA